jgi:hypothetical protein
MIAKAICKAPHIDRPIGGAQKQRASIRRHGHHQKPLARCGFLPLQNETVLRHTLSASGIP